MAFLARQRVPLVGGLVLAASGAALAKMTSGGTTGEVVGASAAGVVGVLGAGDCAPDLAPVAGDTRTRRAGAVGVDRQRCDRLGAVAAAVSSRKVLAGGQATQAVLRKRPSPELSEARRSLW